MQWLKTLLNLKEPDGIAFCLASRAMPLRIGYIAEGGDSCQICKLVCHAVEWATIRGLEQSPFIQLVKAKDESPAKGLKGRQSARWSWGSYLHLGSRVELTLL